MTQPLNEDTQSSTDERLTDAVFDLAAKPLNLKRGKSWKNRITLAPLTNQQSHPDGTLSDDEFNWLTYRAQGGFGMTMTCAALVHPSGQGFPGQLGVYSDDHLDGLTKLATAINDTGSTSIAQLHHAGIRAPKEITGHAPLGPSVVEEGVEEMSVEQIEEITESFVQAAVRCERAGFDGVQIHGAHGYLIAQFMSPKMNQRSDGYGGDFRGRSKLLFDVIDGIAKHCGEDFQVGVRVSPERFGQKLQEQIDLTGWIFEHDRVDFVDVSLWDCRKEPHEEDFHGQRLGEYFASLERHGTALGFAGQLYCGQDLVDVFTSFSVAPDFVSIGKAAIAHHDMAALVLADPSWKMDDFPLSLERYKQEKVGEGFIDYLRGWGTMVE